MPLVLLGDPCGGDEQFARSIAAELGYRCVDEDAIVERAAAWGGCQSSLRKVLEEPPTVLERLTHRWRVQIALLQAALAEELRDGTAIYCGSVAYLLPAVDRHVLRVRLTAPIELRSTLVEERLKLQQHEAVSYIRKKDRQRRAWLRSLYGEIPAPWRANLAIDLGFMEVETASRVIVAAAAEYERLWDARECRNVAEGVALACRVKAQLAVDAATSHLELDVAASGTGVSVQGRVADEAELDDVQRVAQSVPGVMSVDTSGVTVSMPRFFGVVRRHGAPAVGTGRHLIPARIRPVAAMMGAALGFVIIVSILLDTGGSVIANRLGLPGSERVQAFAGIITDTLCARGPEDHHTTECVRNCVKRDGAVKYALYDGGHVYVLGDQQAGYSFAARKVRVTGVLDNGVLQIRTIQPI